jgi:hypothetical protein
MAFTLSRHSLIELIANICHVGRFMSAQYILHTPKATEVWLTFDTEAEALESGADHANDPYDVIGVFFINDDIKTPIAFFWNGQKFVPQKPVEGSTS